MSRRRHHLSRRVAKPLKRLLVDLAVATLPRLYRAYMWLVWKTSTVEDLGPTPEDLRAAYGRGIVALWHDEVFFVAHAFGRFRAHTLASRGDFGALITRMLEMSGFQVFRGGSSAGKSRRSPEILDAMIERMRDHPGVVYGITVDGSNGPAYRMKTGAARLARACNAPLAIERTWCRRYFRLPTWDRTVIPLPFNHIVHAFAGPFIVPRDGWDPRSFTAFCKTVEEELWELAYHTRARFEDPTKQNLLEHHPPGWTPREAPPVRWRPFDEIVVDPPKRRIDDGRTKAAGMPASPALPKGGSGQAPTRPPGPGDGVGPTPSSARGGGVRR